MYFWQIVSRKVVLIYMLNNSTFPHNYTNTLYLRPGFLFRQDIDIKKSQMSDITSKLLLVIKLTCPAIVIKWFLLAKLRAWWYL